jgi:hypothetical protein
MARFGQHTRPFTQRAQNKTLVTCAEFEQSIIVTSELNWSLTKINGKTLPDKTTKTFVLHSFMKAKYNDRTIRVKVIPMYDA